MTWTGWDIAIVTLGVLQLAALMMIGITVLRIVRGPVAAATGRTGDLLARTKALADVGLRAVNANKKHVAAIAADARGIAEALQAPDVTQTLPINYRTLRRSLTTLMTVRRGLKTVQGIASGRTRTAAAVAAAAATKRTRPPRRSMADRLGLVPPAARHLRKAMPYLRLATQVARELSRRRA